jgi:hypothetical protein
VDLRTRQFGGPCADLDTALAETDRFLQAIASNKWFKASQKPSIVASATVRIPTAVMLPEALLVIDVLTVQYDSRRPVLMVGEIKTYPDRGGYTDGAELAAARSQAGVHVHGLNLVIQELGLAKRIEVAETGFLVLSRPGFNQPSIRSGEDLRYQAKRAERGFRQLEEAAVSLPESGSKDLVAMVRRADTSYIEQCVSFCDRASGCHGRAAARGDPMILGENVARFLGTVNLARALSLMEGAMAANEAELDLIRRLGGPTRR